MSDKRTVHQATVNSWLQPARSMAELPDSGQSPAASVRPQRLWESRDNRDMLVLEVGPQGWDIELTHAGVGRGARSPLIALTAESVQSYFEDAPDEAEDEGPEYDAEIGAELAKDYDLPHASGAAEKPGPGVRWAVVTGTWNGVEARDDDHPWGWGEFDRDWEKASWIDLDRCLRLVDKEAPPTNEPPRTVELWQTPDGTGYLLCLHSAYGGELGREWLWCGPEDAAQLIHAVDDADRIEDDALDRSPLLAAVWGMRQAVDALTNWEASGLSAGHAERAARVIGEHLRTVQSDVRSARAYIGRTVRDEHDGDTQAAADELGLAYSTFVNLIRS